MLKGSGWNLTHRTISLTLRQKYVNDDVYWGLISALNIIINSPAVVEFLPQSFEIQKKLLRMVFYQWAKTNMLLHIRMEDGK